jgi:hypothetical protein
MLIFLIILELCSGQKSKCTNTQRVITPNYAKQSINRSYTLHKFSLRSVYLIFHVISLILLELCLDKCFLKGEIIQQWDGTELWFFFTFALLPNEIYLPTRFHVDISYNFRIMFRTKFKV